MRILTINLASKPDIVYETSSGMYPYSLLFVSSFAKKKGLNVKILDLATTINWAKELKAFLENNRFDVIGFTGTTENRFMTCDAILLAKLVQPEAFIIVGGNHFTFTAEQTLAYMPEIDFVVRGEGEITFVELIERLSSGDVYPNIKGISYRKNGEVVHTPPREPEPDIDKFNITEEALEDVIIPIGKYQPFIYLRNWEELGKKALPISIGRGCPAKCVFCIHNKKIYRTREIGSVIDEIKSKVRKFNYKVFHFDDPFLLKRKQSIIDLCNEISRQNLDIKWYAESRVDIDPSILDLMHKAGCISMDFGLESASPKVLKAIRKAINIDQVEEVIKRCYSLGIRVGLFAMISLPEEEEADALMTIDFLMKQHKYVRTIIYTTTLIYPGTELEAMAMEKGVLPRDFNWYDRNYSNDYPGISTSPVPLYVEHLSPDFITQCHERVRTLVQSKQSVRNIIQTSIRQVPGFLFNWETQGLKDKTRKLKVLGKIVKAKIGGFQTGY